MKRILFLILAFCSVKSAVAQSTAETTKKKPAGRQQVVSAGFNIPLGDFASTHIGGIALEYSQRFGQLATIPSKKLGYLFEGGLAYYLGKKETVSGYPYDYPGYYFLHVYPGLVYNPCKKGHISVSAGPALGLYNGNLQFNLGAKLQGTWYVNKKTGITPGVLVMRESGADPLWAASVKATFAF
jgi:hypothetical protein